MCPQRGRSDTRRGQPVGWRPEANSQTVGTIALGRPPTPITTRLPHQLLADRSGRVPATALLQRRCGYLADYRLNSAFAVPERVELGSDSRGGGKRTLRKMDTQGRNRGFLPWAAPLLVLFSRRGEKSPYKPTLLSLSLPVERKGPKERHQREGPTVLPFGNLTPFLRVPASPAFAPSATRSSAAHRAVKSALRPSPATGSERHPSRSTCRGGRPRLYGNCGQEICLKLLTNQKRCAIIHHIIEMQRRNYSRFSVLSESRRMVRADTQNPVSLIPEQSLRTHTVVSGYGSSRYRRRS